VVLDYAVSGFLCYFNDASVLDVLLTMMMAAIIQSCSVM